MALIPIEQIERGVKVLESFVIFFSKRFLPIVFLLSLSDNVWKEVSQLRTEEKHRLDTKYLDGQLEIKDAQNRELNQEIKKNLQDQLDYTKSIVSKILFISRSPKGADSSSTQQY